MQLLRVASMDSITGCPLVFDFYLDGLLTNKRFTEAFKRGMAKQDGHTPSAHFEVAFMSRNHRMGNALAFVVYAEDLCGAWIVGFIYEQFNKSKGGMGYVGVV